MGEQIMPAAALWGEAKRQLSLEKNLFLSSMGIVDLSASGYMLICIDRTGNLIDDLLIVNPRCGAGSGINLSRVLQKLAISEDGVDEILAEYLGSQGKENREKINIRADRCGVFSSSATISDKNQGIPLAQALAVTIKSEVLKPLKRMASGMDLVLITGGVFKWKFARECAEDFLRTIGTKRIEYDHEQIVLLRGSKHIVDSVGEGNFKAQPTVSLQKTPQLLSYPSFSVLQRQYESRGLFHRLPNFPLRDFSAEIAATCPVSIGMDVGSTMAKIVISTCQTQELLFIGSYDNHGDTIETIKHIFGELRSKGLSKLSIQHIGITGSGRYQVQKALQEIYPLLNGRIHALVENYAHARGSIDEVTNHISFLEGQGKTVNKDFCMLVDIGGEDTKISTISLNKKELFDNAMNIKCSAGTGSLMDTLKAMFNISSIAEACKLAYEAEKSYAISATCAVFLMENARKMLASGYPKEEILASANYAIVENMARSLWDQIEFFPRSVVLLHGQTMLSNPLPLAVTRRMIEYVGEDMYCLLPPYPGHRACFGLIKSMSEYQDPIIDEFTDLDKFIERKFEKKIIICQGAACGDKGARCMRTKLTSKEEDGRSLSLTLGGCSAVNNLVTFGKKKVLAADCYKALWDFISEKMPTSTDNQRVIIPRSFAISEQAYFLSKVLSNLGIPVHVDRIIEQDILNAMPFFTIDTCAPNIGAAGQFARLANSAHGFILVPQIDLLDTDKLSVGRTCTTNQGGVVVAKHYAESRFPDAKFLLFDLRLEVFSAQHIGMQLYHHLQSLFNNYGVNCSIDAVIEAVESAIAANAQLKREVSDLAAKYIEEAIENKANVTIVIAREYILNPGIYDSHIGRLLRDKGVYAIPSFVFEVELSQNFGDVYWRNSHKNLSMVDAISRKELHTIIKHQKLSEAIKKLEHREVSSLLSMVQVSTFRCGPDAVTNPQSMELTKHMPSLFIQSDAMIKELAHLENRINTHINQLEKGLYEELDNRGVTVEILEEFNIREINPETDVLYLPTLADNRTLAAVMKASGVSTIYNFDDSSYDLEKIVKRGRSLAGDFVCLPLAAIVGDVLFALEDFIEKKRKGDPQVEGKSRLLFYNNQGTGPCRQGQFCEVNKVLLPKYFSSFTSRNKSDENSPISLRQLLGHEERHFEIGSKPWVAVQGVHSVVVKDVLHGLFLKIGAQCKNKKEFDEFEADFLNLKEQILDILENKIIPSPFGSSFVEFCERRFPKLSGPAKFFAYGLYNNNGIRKLLRKFADKWNQHREARENKGKLRIHVDGEGYLRVAQLESIFRVIVDAVGFNHFELSYTPVWSYFEYILEWEILEAREEIKLASAVLSRYSQTTSSQVRQESAGYESAQFLSGDGVLKHIEVDKNEQTRSLPAIGSRSRNKLEKCGLGHNPSEAESKLHIIRKKEGIIEELKENVHNLRKILAKPLYDAARLSFPHPMVDVLDTSLPILPTLKPYGELAPYIGECIMQLQEGVDLILNVAPEGCMVSAMGEMLTPQIFEKSQSQNGRIQYLFSLNGEIDQELLKLALLKTRGPERFYTLNCAVG